jgi:hypothetical protein
MRDEQNYRWLFAEIGLTIQTHQLEAFILCKSIEELANPKVGTHIEGFTNQSPFALPGAL